MSLTGQVIYQFVATQTDELDLESLRGAINYSKNKAFTDGTGSGKVQVVFSDTRTLGASGTEDLDLAGVLTNGFGKTITFTKIKAIMIHADPTNNAANLVVVSRPSSNGLVLFGAASGALAGLQPDGAFIFLQPGAGLTVTASTGDLLTITNSAGTNAVSYDVIIMGEGTLA